jgi:ligand-binding SRPBCC domain-containing protein
VSRIEIETIVHAPIERVFDLARSIDAHVASTPGTEERPIAGKTSGLIDLGEEVTWQARHFFVRQHLTSRIVLFDRPTHFRDSMVKGAFKRFDHDHFFTSQGDGKSTLCRDVFEFEAPLGPLGKIADWLVLHRYMMRLLQTRLRILKELAEGDDWKMHLP